MRDFLSNIFQKTFPGFYTFSKSLRDKLDVVRQNSIPFVFDARNYPNTFLANNSPIKRENLKIERVIYCFWTGNNPMSENRIRGLKSLEEKTGIKVKLITPKNLENYVLQDSPLHEGYQYLSAIHKADYLRSYFMHFYGGGYADIKPFNHSWIPAFEKIEKNTEKYIIGYTEIRRNAVANVGGRLVEDMRKYYTKILGNGAYVCRSQTNFTYEWLTELNKRMDAYLPALQSYNYDANDYKGKNPDYPVKYLSILGEIFHPLCLKYHDKLLHDQKLLPELTNYQ